MWSIKGPAVERSITRPEGDTRLITTSLPGQAVENTTDAEPGGTDAETLMVCPGPTGNVPFTGAPFPRACVRIRAISASPAAFGCMLACGSNGSNAAAGVSHQGSDEQMVWSGNPDPGPFISTYSIPASSAAVLIVLFSRFNMSEKRASLAGINKLNVAGQDVFRETLDDKNGLG